MSRNKALTVLQKTYDDSYLSCSTAVYHESQGNELEAMRHWRGALEQIYDHNANKVPPTYAPRSDTEKALMEALKELELQCKERIDLLEALRASRNDGPTTKTSGKLSKAPEQLDSMNRSKGSIGQGTIPAVSYAELSRPSLPHRPSLPSRPSLEATSKFNSSDVKTSMKPSVPSISTPKSRSPTRPTESNNTARSHSPDKYTMRTTLRSGKLSDKQPKSSRRSPRPASEGPSKAATLAWSALSSRENAYRSTSTPSDSYLVSQTSGSRNSSEQPRKSSSQLQWDTHSRRLVPPQDSEFTTNGGSSSRALRHSDEYPRPPSLSVSAASSALTYSQEMPVPNLSPGAGGNRTERSQASRVTASADASPRLSKTPTRDSDTGEPEIMGKTERKAAPIRTVKKEWLKTSAAASRTTNAASERANRARRREPQTPLHANAASSSDDETIPSPQRLPIRATQVRRTPQLAMQSASDESMEGESCNKDSTWKKRKGTILRNLPPGVEESAAKQILNDIVVRGDEVHWGDIAGLEVAKNALREAVVYPFLRPDLFMGLREPARGMLLFGPPGTGKTMLARAVATESRSTFFSISASSLTSKFLGESEKLVRALFGLAKALAPSIIFVDEIDSLLSQRSGSGEHEATRRIKTEFLIQWSDLQRAAAGRETSEKDKERGDANRVLVLAATNLPWAIDEAARRRFVRRQYIPLPEPSTRETQLRTLLGQQKHGLSNRDISRLVELTDGFSGSDITALAKDAAMGPLRSLGDALLHMTMDDIRPITMLDFEASLGAIRPSVSKTGLKEYEDWARDFGERAG